MHLQKFFNSETGKVMLSIVLGVGLASLFRTVCTGKNCVVFKAPPLEDFVEKSFRYGDKCYQYTAVATKCDPNKKIIEM